MESEFKAQVDVSKLWLAAILFLMVLTGRGGLGRDPFLEGFGWTAVCFAVAILCYLWILRKPSNEHILRYYIIIGIILRMGMIWPPPNLSDDFYRYVWDGRLWLEGVNPFDFTPTEWMGHPSSRLQSDWQPLFEHLNSQKYHTVYPPVLQAVFAGCAYLGRGEVFLTVIFLKITILWAEVGNIWLISKIARRLNLPQKSVLVYALNPLVVVELMGNCHFEALMIFFLLAAFWFLMEGGGVLSAPFLALSIGTKLLPALVFPFLVRRLGWRRAFLLGSLTAACSIPLFWPVLQGDRIQHFGESLRLYFHSFEFNGGLYYLLRWILGDFGHWANRVLPWLMVGCILASAWRERSRGWTGLPAAMMHALTIYQLLSPVLHPWYVTPVVAMAALGPYRYPVLWSLFLPFTYASYFHSDGVHEPAWLLVLEYVPLFGFMAYEWIFRRQRVTLTELILRSSPLLRMLAQRSIPPRLTIKLERIAKHLGSGDRILDIGTGNGGLCLALRNKSLDIMPLDVVNLSFFPDVVPVIYDGTRIPFADKSYDTSLLVTMLHHTPNPEAVIREAIRVTRGKLVIMEDIYRNNLQRRLTFFADSLVNLEFEGHPHTNLNDGQWKALFDRLDLKLVYGEEFRTLIFFRQVVYVLEIPSGTRGTASHPGRVME